MGEHAFNKSNLIVLMCAPCNKQDELGDENPIMSNLSRSPKYTIIEKILREENPKLKKNG